MLFGRASTTGNNADADDEVEDEQGEHLATATIRRSPLADGTSRSSDRFGPVTNG